MLGMQYLYFTGILPAPGKNQLPGRYFQHPTVPMTLLSVRSVPSTVILHKHCPLSKSRYSESEISSEVSGAAKQIKLYPKANYFIFSLCTYAIYINWILYHKIL